MPVAPLFSPSDSRSFGNALFLSPSKLSSQTQEWIANTIGQSENRLNITRHTMLEGFANEDISAVGMVWRGDGSSWAFGCLQYYDWLDRGEPQMWLTDLCRIGARTCPTSPVADLLSLLKTPLLQHGIKELWLMVECGESEAILCRVYEAYGFQRVRVSRKLNSILMKQILCV